MVSSGWVGTANFIPGPLFQLEIYHKLIGLVQVIKIVTWIGCSSSKAFFKLPDLSLEY
jgi:hypothetical protein